jgi:hypothetical protein
MRIPVEKRTCTAKVAVLLAKETTAIGQQRGGVGGW